MPSPNRRTWTLGSLDPGQVYVLWFDGQERRWEVRAVPALDPSADAQGTAPETAIDPERTGAPALGAPGDPRPGPRPAHLRVVADLLPDPQDR